MAWFSPTQHSPELLPPQLPIGKYRVRILKSGKRMNKDNTGAMLAFDVGILDGANAGQSGSFNLNIWNANETASRIAAGHLAAMCQVCGIYNDLNAMPEGAELWGKDFMIEIVQQKDTNYVQLNNIFDVNGNPPVAWAKLGAPMQQAAPPQQFGGMPGPQSAMPQQMPQQPQQGGFPAPQGQPMPMPGGFPAPATGGMPAPVQGGFPAPAGMPQQPPAMPQPPPGQPPAWTQQPGAMPTQPPYGQR